MPIYEYRCENGHTFEVFQSMSDDPVTACEQCGAPVERVFHPVAIHFKGSGFHNTDYKNKDKDKDKDKAGAANDGKAAGDGGDSGSSDGKSDSGSDGKKSDSSKADSATKAASSD